MDRAGGAGNEAGQAEAFSDAHHLSAQASTKNFEPQVNPSRRLQPQTPFLNWCGSILLSLVGHSNTAVRTLTCLDCKALQQA